MAQNRERAPAKSATSASTPEKPGTPATEAPKRGFSLARLLAPRPPQGQTGANGQPARPRSQFSKMLFGLLILMLAAQVFQVALFYADAQLHLNLSHYIAGTAGGTKPGDAFLFGGMTWFALIYFGAIIGLYFVLLRFNILPKDPFGTRAAANRSAQSSGSSVGSTARAGTRSNNPPPLPSGVNPNSDRTRAARREAQRRATVVAPPPQKASLLARMKVPAALSAAIGRTSTKTASNVNAKTASNVSTKTANGSVAKTSTTSARKANGNSSAGAPSADAMYERVRSEQRLRKRRAAKR
ncbi:MAG TPA: hypothetical protein VFU88_22075 [Ktedonobacterales bacterium]|nr:hypothetical protein [Ktedonobacterales bacterium]